VFGGEAMASHHEVGVKRGQHEGAGGTVEAILDFGFWILDWEVTE